MNCVVARPDEVTGGILMRLISASIANATTCGGRKIYARVHLLLGHTKLESTVRYLVIEVDDALVISEQTDV